MYRNYKRQWRVFTIILAVFCMAFLSGREASAQEKKIRVGVFELNGFYEKNEEGQPDGYGAEYLDKLSEKTGWTYEYIWAENWDECVELLRQGRVDLIAPAQKTEERMKEFDFSAFGIGMECGTLIALSTNEKLIYEDFESFSQIKIGCVDTLIFKDSFLDYAEENSFQPSLVSYRDTKALMAALNSGEVDAALVNLFVNTDTTKVLAKFGVASFYYMVRKDNPSFSMELNEALQQIKIEFVDFETNLMEKYYPSFNHMPFTKEELEFIEAAPVLRVACRTNIRPLSFLNEETGEIEGITRDILDEISHISGLKFEYAAIPQGIINYDFFWENDISLISSVEYNKENISAPGIHLTMPYINSKKVFVCKKDTYFNKDTSLMLAVATGSETLIKRIQKQYPNFQVMLCNTVEECFAAVRKGDADALLQNQYVVPYFLSKPLYSDMTTIPVEGFEDLLCLSPVVNREKGVLDSLLSDERLISVLNKSIRQISADKTAKIIIKQTADHQYQYTYEDFLYQYRYPLGAMAFISLLLLAALWLLISAKRRNMLLIMENETKLRNITNNINGGVVVLKADDKLRITYANEGFLDLLQCNAGEYGRIWNQEYNTYVHPDDLETLKALMSMDIRKDNQVSIKLRIMRKDGNYIPTLFNGTLTENSVGDRQIYCVIMDISEQESLMEKITLQQLKYSILIEHSGDIIFEVDCRRKELMVSSLYGNKFGWKLKEAALSEVITDMFRVLKVHKEDLGNMEILASRVFTQEISAEGQARIQKIDGSFLWCQISLYPMANAEGELVDIIGKIQDVDREVRAKEELEHKSRTDALTGLMNKEAFFADARQYLKESRGKNTAVVFIDLDNFKQINDQLGHMMGDLAIRETAKKLQVIFSNYDLLARFGGDEFCVLLKEIPEETLKEKLAWTVEKLRADYKSEEQIVHCSASIGAVCTYGRKRELEFLLEQADKALYYVKESGKSQYALYDEIG